MYAFQTIQDFVNNLHDYFGKKCHSLNLYRRLVEKLSFGDHNLITRHLQTFKDFCVANRTAIREKNVDGLAQRRIEFSDNIYIDVKWVCEHSDADTRNTIWEYILTISALLDPSNKAKELLGTLKEGTKEDQFLSSMIETVGQQVGDAPVSNPMEMVGSLMNSDVMGNLLQSMQSGVGDGKLDMNKLMSSMQGIMKNVQSQIESSDDPMVQNLMNMVSSLANQVD